MGVDYNFQKDVLLLRNKLITLCEEPNYTPDFLQGNKYWESFKEIFGIMGDCQ